MQLVIGNNLLYKGTSLSATLTNVVLPSGIVAGLPRPAFARQRRSTLIQGRYSPPLAWNDAHSLINIAGISKPLAAPTLAVQGVGITGSIIGHYSYLHKVGTEIIHIGNLSPASATLNLANQGIRWTLPGSSPDARVTHIRLWRSVDGSLPKMVVDLPIATLTYDEAVAYDALPEVFPPVFSDGTLHFDARNPPFYTLFCFSYHGRMFYGGDPLNPSRVWYSLINEPESVGPNAYVETRDREAVTGICESGDQLLIGCHDAMYDLQGYSAGPTSDFNMRKVSDSVGLISHHSFININGNAWGAAIDGIYRWEGSRPKFMMKKLRTLWRDSYTVDKVNYENCIAIDDRYWHTYKLLIPGSAGAFYYVGHYMPVENAIDGGEDQPWWVVDKRNRGDYALGSLFNILTGRDEVCVGGGDGYVRKENVAADANDDSDTYLKTAIIRTKHFFLGDQSGALSRGKTIKSLDLYQKTENQGYTVKIYGGDDAARDAIAPTWGPYAFPAQGLVGSVPETSKYFRPAGVSGKGYTLEIVVESPVNYEYRGHSTELTGGPQTRGVTT